MLCGVQVGERTQGGRILDPTPYCRLYFSMNYQMYHGVYCPLCVGLLTCASGGDRGKQEGGRGGGRRGVCEDGLVSECAVGERTREQAQGGAIGVLLW